MKHPTCPHEHPECPLPAEREALRKLVSVDELTGLFNFRFLKNALEREMERTRRTGLATGLIMVDLDHFKQVNDIYGHENGNLALQAAAGIWKTQLRKIDIPCSYGGEEFVIILPNTRIRDAIQAAERLRRELSATPLEMGRESIRLTASFGVDEYREGERLTVDAFIHRVDMFVLAAKNQGRNRVCYDHDRVAQQATEVTAQERESLFLKRKP